MHWLTWLFLLAVLASCAIRLWLAGRQAAAVARHRNMVPAPFVASVPAAEHSKAADYTIAKLRFGRITLLVDTILVLWLTLGGGIAALDALWRQTGWPQPWLGAAVVASVALLAELVREDRFDFLRCEAREQRIEEHDSLVAPDAGEVGIAVARAA